MKIKATKNSQFYNSLMRKIIVLMGLISIIPLIFIGAVTIYNYGKSSRESVIAYQKAIVNNHKIHIDFFLKQKLSDIQTLTDVFPVERLLDNFFLKKQLRILKNRYGDFVDLGIIDSKGYQRAYDGPFRLEHANYSEADWFKKAMNKDYYISDVFLGIRGLPHFIIAIKLKDSSGRLWIIRSTIDIEKFTSMVEDINIGTTGYAFILNTKGEFQTKLNIKEKGDLDFINYIINTTISKTGVSAFEYTKKSGIEVIYAVSYLKNGEWLLICQQDSDDAFSTLYHVRKLIIFISSIGLLTVLFISFMVTKNLVGYMQRVDQERSRLGEQVIEAGKLASLGELAAGIAHEVNNPVAIMVEEAGWSQDLLEEEEFKNSKNLDEFNRALNQIKVQGERCKQITHKLLSFARKTQSQAKELQLNEAIEDVVSLSQRTARYSNIIINIALDDNIPVINASPSEIQQVLLNMVNNAIDAIGKDGGEINISTRIDNEFVVIDISDTGEGIPEANLQRIFDPFFTTKPVGKGTGIGLSICYGIIYRMGGKITVSTHVGKGTTFHIYLPLNEKDKQEGK